MNEIILMLKNYIPFNEQEREDVKIILNACNLYKDIFTRDNKLCHFTASAFVINKQHTKVLCIYHNIYKSWGWVGGHADGDKDLLYVAQKETKEETSLNNFNVISNSPISIEILPVSSHIRKGLFVPTHLHFNVTFLFEADEKDSIHILEEENSNIGWLEFDDLLTKSEEPYMKPIYKKIIERIKTLN